MLRYSHTNDYCVRRVEDPARIKPPLGEVTIRCPVCHSSVTTFTPTDAICPDLHPHLTIKCPQWRFAEGVCNACLDAIEMDTDEILQSILNGTPAPQQDERVFTYALSERETPYWSHTDPTVQNWFRNELRRRVRQLADGGAHEAWRIVDCDRHAVDEGEV